MKPNERVFIKETKKKQQQQQNQTKTGRLFWRRWGMHITTATETAVLDFIPCSAIGLDGKQKVFLSTFNVAICISAFRKVSSLHPPLAFITIARFCYITIFIELFHHQAQIQGQALNNNVGNQMNILRYIKTVSNALSLCIWHCLYALLLLAQREGSLLLVDTCHPLPRK